MAEELQKSSISKLMDAITKLSSGDIKIPDYSKLYTPAYDWDAINRVMKESIQPLQVEVDPLLPDGYFEKTLEYQQKSLEMLQSIKENTANLYTMVELINKSNENQKELLEILTEILAISAAKDKKEAENLFKKVMGKVTQTTDDVDTIIKICGWAMAVYNIVSAMLP